MLQLKASSKLVVFQQHLSILLLQTGQALFQTCQLLFPHSGVAVLVVRFRLKFIFLLVDELYRFVLAQILKIDILGETEAVTC